MKKNEFIKEVEVMGFEVELYGGNLFIIDKHGNECAKVAEYGAYRIDTVYPGFEYITETEQEQLFKLLTEYASTPIEER